MDCVKCHHCMKILYEKTVEIKRIVINERMIKNKKGRNAYV